MKTEELNLVSLAKKYSDNDTARDLLESLRWPNGAVCPHCKSNEAYKLTPKADSKSPGRKGLYKCKTCRKQFTVTVGTIFADTHIPIGTWLMAIFLLCSSKQAMSAHQLHRMLGITYKSVWFMAHRIRYGMTEVPLAEMLKGAIEVDETYVGRKLRGGRRGRGSQNKTPVMALVERNGNVKTRVVERVTSKNLHVAIRENVHTDSVILTDEWPAYNGIGEHFVGGHASVNHGAKEYFRDGVHTNTAESFFSLLKRGVFGAFHHVSKHHLHRYCDEFSFRWNSRKMKDGDRMQLAIAGFEGKRLTYRDS